MSLRERVNLLERKIENIELNYAKRSDTQLVVFEDLCQQKIREAGMAAYSGPYEYVPIKKVVELLLETAGYEIKIRNINKEKFYLADLFKGKK